MPFHALLLMLLSHNLIHTLLTEVEVRDRSFFSRLRGAWSSLGERRRRLSSTVTPTPVDHGVTRSYGSLSEVPTEFNPTLPPPPARSFPSRASSADGAIGAAAANAGMDDRYFLWPEGLFITLFQCSSFIFYLVTIAQFNVQISDRFSVKRKL